MPGKKEKRGKWLSMHFKLYIMEINNNDQVMHLLACAHDLRQLINYNIKHFSESHMMRSRAVAGFIYIVNVACYDVDI